MSFCNVTATWLQRAWLLANRSIAIVQRIHLPQHAPPAKKKASLRGEFNNNWETLVILMAVATHCVGLEQGLPQVFMT